MPKKNREAVIIRDLVQAAFSLAETKLEPANQKLSQKIIDQLFDGWPGKMEERSSTSTIKKSVVAKDNESLRNINRSQNKINSLTESLTILNTLTEPASNTLAVSAIKTLQKHLSDMLTFLTPSKFLHDKLSLLASKPLSPKHLLEVSALLTPKQNPPKRKTPAIESNTLPESPRKRQKIPNASIPMQTQIQASTLLNLPVGDAACRELASTPSHSNFDSPEPQKMNPVPVFTSPSPHVARCLFPEFKSPRVSQSNAAPTAMHIQNSNSNTMTDDHLSPSNAAYLATLFYPIQEELYTNFGYDSSSYPASTPDPRLAIKKDVCDTTLLATFTKKP
jgi:hypothetical protein